MKPMFLRTVITAFILYWGALASAFAYTDDDFHNADRAEDAALASANNIIGQIQESGDHNYRANLFDQHAAHMDAAANRAQDAFNIVHALNRPDLQKLTHNTPSRINEHRQRAVQSRAQAAQERFQENLRIRGEHMQRGHAVEEKISDERDLTQRAAYRDQYAQHLGDVAVYTQAAIDLLPHIHFNDKEKLSKDLHDALANEKSAIAEAQKSAVADRAEAPHRIQYETAMAARNAAIQTANALMEQFRIEQDENQRTNLVNQHAQQIEAAIARGQEALNELPHLSFTDKAILIQTLSQAITKERAEVTYNEHLQLATKTFIQAQEKSIVQQSIVHNEMEKIPLLKEVATLYEQAKNHFEAGCTALLEVGLIDQVAQRKEHNNIFYEEASKAINERDTIIHFLQNRITENEQAIEKAIEKATQQKVPWNEESETALAQARTLQEVSRELTTLHQQSAIDHAALEQKEQQHHHEQQAAINRADDHAYGAAIIAYILDRKSATLPLKEVLKSHWRIIRLYERSIAEREPVVVLPLQQEIIHLHREELQKRQNALHTAFPETSFTTTLNTLWQAYKDLEITVIAEKYGTALKALIEHIQAVQAYYEAAEMPYDKAFWEYHETLVQAEKLSQAASEAKIDSFLSTIDTQDPEVLLKEYKTLKETLTEAQEKITHCLTYAQEHRTDEVQGNEATLERIKKGLETLTAHENKLIIAERKATKEKKNRFYRAPVGNPNRKDTLSRGSSSGSSWVKALNGQEGVPIDTIALDISPQPWFKRIQTTPRRHLGHEPAVLNPLAAFGDDTGGTALYTGRTYQFAVSSGQLFWPNVNDPEDDRNLNLLIKVYSKQKLAAEQSNVAPDYEEAIALPCRSNHTSESLQKLSPANNLWGKLFMDERGSIYVINGDLLKRYGMKMTIEYPGHTRAWNQGHDSVLILSHQVFSSQYFYSIELKGYVNDGNSASDQRIPVVTCIDQPEAESREAHLKSFSPLYTLSFTDSVPNEASFIKKPTFIPTLTPPHYAFEKNPSPPLKCAKVPNSQANASASSAEEENTLSATEPCTLLGDYDLDAFKKPYSADTHVEQVELRDHEAIDAVLKQCNYSAMALAAYVQNEIELTDGFSIPRGAAADNPDPDALYPGIFNRGASGVLQQGQGSPWEQCALLVKLLRKAGYAAGYAEMATGTLVLDRERFSTMAKMQFQGYQMGNHGRGESILTQPTKPVAEIVAFQFPWVAFYDEVAQQWRHLFPWIKDIEIEEGDDVRDYLPEGYENAQKWVRAYLENDPYILKHIGSDGNDTAGVLFEKFLAEQAEQRGRNLGDIGVHYHYRKHDYKTWDSFPMPLRMWGTIKLTPSLQERDELFAKLKVEVYSKSNPEKTIATPWLRMAEVNNRELYVYHEPLDEAPDCQSYIVNLRLGHFSEQYSGPKGDFNHNYALGPQQQHLQIDATDRQIQIKTHYNAQTTGSAKTFFNNFNITALDEIKTVDLPIDRGATAAICVTYGRVTSAMVQEHADRFERYNTTPSAYHSRGTLTYMAGVAYFERLSKAERFLRRIYKLAEFPIYGVGLSKFTPDLTPGSPNLSPEGHLQGKPILRYPQVDMLFYEYNSMANETLHPNNHNDALYAAKDYQLLSIADGSSNEHQALNDTFQDRNAISTVKLLQLAHKRHQESGQPGSGFMVVTQTNFEKINRTENILGREMAAIKTELKAQWNKVAKAFNYNLETNTFENLESENFYHIAYVTPGVVHSDDGNANDPAHPPSYKGCGSLIFSTREWFALISGNDNYINGGYGSRLPEEALSDAHMPKLSITRTKDQRISIEGLKPKKTSTPAFMKSYGLHPETDFAKKVDAVIEAARKRMEAKHTFGFQAHFQDDISGVYGHRAPLSSAATVEVTSTASSPEDADTSPSRRSIFEGLLQGVIDKHREKKLSTRRLNPEKPTLTFNEDAFREAAQNKASFTLDSSFPTALYQDQLKASQHPGSGLYSEPATPLSDEAFKEYLEVVKQELQAIHDRGRIGQIVATEDRPQTGILGDPIDLATGAFYSDTVDLTLNGPFPFQLRRNYSSQNVFDGDFGYGWKRNIVAHLDVCESNGVQTIKAAENNGTVVLYRKQSDCEQYTVLSSDNPELISGGLSENGRTIDLFKGTIDHAFDGDGEKYTLHGADGSTRTYRVRSFPLGDIERKRPYLETWVDVNGNALSFEYGQKPETFDYGQVTRIANATGNAIHFSYNASRYVAQAWTQEGYTVSYDYDDFNDLVKVSYPDGSWIQYAYELSSVEEDEANRVYSTHRLIQEERPGGRLLTNVYDEQRRVICQSASLGESSTPVPNLTIDYSPLNDATEAKEPLKTTVVVHDGHGEKTTYSLYQGRIYKIIDPLGYSLTYSWYTDRDHYFDLKTEAIMALPDEAPRGYPAALRVKRDKQGVMTTYTYDTQGNIIQEEVTGDDLTGAGETTLTHIYHYDPIQANRLLEHFHWGSDGKKRGVRYSYESPYPYLPTKLETFVDATVVETILREYEAVGGCHGLLKKETHQGLPGDSPAIVEFQHNAQGWIEKRVVCTGTRDPDLVTTFKYNLNGQCFEETDQAGNITRYRYDVVGRCLGHEVYNSSGQRISSTYAYYNKNGEMAWQHKGGNTSRSTTYWHYNRAGQVVATAQPYISAQEGVLYTEYGKHSYHGAMTLKQHDLLGYLTRAVDAGGNITTYQNDALGRPIVVEREDGLKETYAYDSRGKVTEYRNVAGHVTHYTYTSLGWTKKITPPHGKEETFFYDLEGRCIENNTERVIYDDVQRSITRVDKKTGHSTTSTLDFRGNPKTTTDAAGNTTTYRYDSLGRVIEVIDIAGHRTHYHYDATVQTQTVVDALGHCTMTTFDALGRTLSIVLQDSQGNELESSTYNYAENGYTVTEQLGDAVYRSKTYDQHGRLLMELQDYRGVDGNWEQATLTHKYDKKGNRTSSTDQVGSVTYYEYDRCDRLAKTIHPDGTETTYSYDTLGQLTEMHLPDNCTWKAQYDPVTGELVEEKLTCEDKALRPFTYTYKEGSLLELKDPRGTLFTYTYNDTEQLVSIAASTGEVRKYGYDAAGRQNVIEQIDPEGRHTVVERTFDKTGNLLIEEIKHDHTQHQLSEQTWDAIGQCITLSTVAGDRQQTRYFDYNGAARITRVRVDDTDWETTYAYRKDGLLYKRQQDRLEHAFIRIKELDQLPEIMIYKWDNEVILQEETMWNTRRLSAGLGQTEGPKGVHIEAYGYDHRKRLVEVQLQMQETVQSYKCSGTNTLLRHIERQQNGNSKIWKVLDQLGSRVQAEYAYTNDSNSASTAEAKRPEHLPLGIDSETYTATAQALLKHEKELAYGFIQQIRRLGLDDSPIDETALARIKQALEVPESKETDAFTALLRVIATMDKEAIEAVLIETYFDQLEERQEEWTALLSYMLSLLEETIGVHPDCRYTYDALGNLLVLEDLRNGTTQRFTWNAWNQLIKVEQADGLWEATYDGLGRRLSTTYTPHAGTTPTGEANQTGPPITTKSYYDPEVEFLEIGLSVNDRLYWKLYGPDLNGDYGGLQGVGGLEAIMDGATGTVVPLLKDLFGNVIGYIHGETIVQKHMTWNPYGTGEWVSLDKTNETTESGKHCAANDADMQCGGIDSNDGALLFATKVAETIGWRSRRQDATGLIYMGARYYRPVSGRFISPDPFGHSGSLDLYNYAEGDPINYFDPDGRFASAVYETSKEGLDLLGFSYPSQEELAIRRQSQEYYGSSENYHKALFQTQLMHERQIMGTHVITPVDRILKPWMPFVANYRAREDLGPNPFVVTAVVPEFLLNIVGIGNAGKAAKIASGLEKGVRNPNIKKAIDIGNRAHDDLARKIEAKSGSGWEANPILRDRTTGKKLIPDGITPSGRPIELKPNTPSGRKAGQRQLKKYEEATGRKGMVIYYDPKDYM